MFTCEQPLIVNLSGYEATMPKAEPKSGARQRPRRRSVQLPNGIEGQIAELCRDLAVEAKRMRQLQEQADELRTALRDWVSDVAPADRKREPVSRAGRH